MNNVDKVFRAPIVGRILLPGVLVLLGLIPVAIWFKPHFLITGNDFTMPFDPGLVFREIWSGWLNSEGIGGSSSSDQLPNLLYIGFLSLWRDFAIPLDVVEAILFGLIISAAGLSMWILTGRWWQSPTARFTSSCLFMLSPCGMILWHNGEAIGMIGYSLAPLVLYFVDVALTDFKLPRWYWSALAMTAIALSAPAHIPPVIFGEAVIPVAVFSLVSICFRKRRLKVNTLLWRLGLSFLVVVGASLWWLIPAAYNLVSGSIAFASGYFKLTATSGPPDLSVPVSLFDQITGFGFWDWHISFHGFPDYPFASQYSTFGMKILILIPLFLAVLGIVWLIRKDGKIERRVVAVGVALWVVGFFLSAGFEGPFGMYRWVYAHWKPFQVFRSPYYDFPVIQSLGLALLAGAGMFWLDGEAGRKIRHLLLPVRSLLYCALIVCLSIAIVFPMFGSMYQTRDSIGQLRYYSALPTYVKSLVVNVNSEKYCNVYFPVGDSNESSVAYSWYQGGTANVDQLFRCTLIGGTQQPVSNSELIGDALDNAIANNIAPREFQQLLMMIGVTDVIVPLDYVWDYYSLGLKPTTVINYFQQFEGFFSERVFGAWIDFRVNTAAQFVQTVTLPKISYLSMMNDLTKNSDNLLDHSLMLNPSAKAFITDSKMVLSNNVTNEKQSKVKSSGKIFKLPNGTFELRDLRGTVLVISHNSFDSNWMLKLSGGATGTRAPSVKHVEVNGFQNGWFVTGRGNYILRVVYPPSELVILSIGVSSLMVLMVTFFAMIAVFSKQRCVDPL